MSTLEIVYQVIDGDIITVGPSPDFPGNVLLSVPTESKEFFGDLRLDMDAEFMQELGEALVRAAADAKKYQEG